MNEKRNMITSKQLMILLITAQIGTGIITLPNILANEVGHDGWISVILAWVISSIIVVFTMSLMKRYSDKSILDINKLIFGKYAGTLINVIIIVYLFLTTVVLLREIVDIVHVTILKLTPELILTIMLLIPTIYLGWYGVKSFCRFSNIIIYLAAVIIVILIVTIKNLKLSFLMPVGSDGIKIISKGVFPSFFSFLGIELPTIFYHNVTDKEKAFKYVIIGNIMTGFFFTMIVFFSIGIFGENMVKHLVYPLLNIPRILKMPIIERMDVYFIMLWIPVMGGSARAFFISTFYSIERVFNTQKRGIYYVFFIFIVLIASRIPRDYDVIYHYENFINIYGITINIYLVLCYVISFIVKRGIEVK